MNFIETVIDSQLCAMLNFIQYALSIALFIKSIANSLQILKIKLIFQSIVWQLVTKFCFNQILRKLVHTILFIIKFYLTLKLFRNCS